MMSHNNVHNAFYISDKTNSNRAQTVTIIHIICHLFLFILQTLSFATISNLLHYIAFYNYTIIGACNHCCTRLFTKKKDYMWLQAGVWRQQGICRGEAGELPPHWIWPLPLVRKGCRGNGKGEGRERGKGRVGETTCLTSPPPLASASNTTLDGSWHVPRLM